MAANWLTALFPRLTSRKSRRAGHALLARPRMVQLEDRSTPAASVFSISGASVTEGNSGTANAVFTVTLTADAADVGKTLSIIYATGIDTTGTNPATVATDYTPTGGTFTFTPAAAGPTTQTFSVPVIGDTVVEPNETFLAGLGTPLSTGATQPIINPAAGVATGTITDDDSTSLTVSSPTVTEGNTGTATLTYTVTSSNAVQGGFQVAYSAVDGTATAASGDYVATGANSTLTFTGLSAGESHSFNVTVNGDKLVEANETVIGHLGTVTPTNAAIPLSKFNETDGTGTINNDDSAAFSVAGASVTEGTNVTSQLTFTVSLSNPVDVATSVTLTTADGTATGKGVDYLLVGLTPADAPTVTVNFAAGQTTAQVLVNIASDNIVEGDETFTATLGGLNTGGRPTVTIDAGNKVATGTINNDDSAAFSVSGASVTEGTGVTSQLTFTVSLSNPVDVATSVTLTTADGTATGKGVDYLLVGVMPNATPTVTVNFAAGQTTAQVLVNIASDNIVEGDETFTATLGGLSTGGRSTVTLPAAGQVATGTILNDDAAAFSVAGMSVTEGTGGTTLLGFTVSLSNPVDVATSVTLTTADGTATGGGVDYLLSGLMPNATPTLTVNFLPGDTKYVVVVGITTDNIVEGDETFTATLGGLSTGGRSTVTLPAAGQVATGTILNDDAAAFSVAGMSVTEGTGGTTLLGFTVSLSNPVDVATSVTLTTADGTATGGGVDYLLSGLMPNATPTLTVNFLPGDTKYVVVVGITTDNIVEGDETFTATLGGLSTGGRSTVTLPAAGQVATGTILNDDAAAFSVAGMSVTEGTGGTTLLGFTVSLSNPVDVATSVTLTTADGTATGGGVDYLLSGLMPNATPTLTVNFLPGDTKYVVVVGITTDNIVEGDETFTATLGGLNTGGSSQVSIDGGNKTATGTIVNDDQALFSIGSLTKSESDGQFGFVVTLSNPVDVPVGVTFTTADGTATAGSDYTAVTQVLTFNPGGPLTQTVNVAITDDRRLEGAESLTATLSALSNGGRKVFLDPAGTTATGTILDNETAVLAFDQAADATAEDNVTKTVNVSLTINAIGTGPVGIDRDVNAALVPSGTATPGTQPTADYSFTQLPATTFSKGSNADASNKLSQTVTINVFEDLLTEGTEAAVLALNLSTKLGGQVTVGTNPYTLTINDDDATVRTYDASQAGQYELVRVGGLDQLLLNGTVVAQDAVGTTPILLHGTPTGDETFTINLSGGNPIPTGGVAFNGDGQAAGGDTLIITGGKLASVVDNYAALTPLDGQLVTDLGTISYANVEASQLNVTSLGTATFNLPAAAASLDTLQEVGGQDTLTVSTFIASTTTFTKPTNGLTVNRGGTADALTVGTLNLGNADLTLGSSGKPFDSITQTGPVTTTQSATFYGDTVAINGDLSANTTNIVATASATQTGKITTGTLTLGEANNAGDYTLLNAGNDLQTLTVPQAKSVALLDANNLTLAAITTTAGLAVSVPGSLAITPGVTALSNGNVYLNANSDLTVGGTATVRAGGNLTATAGGNLTLAAGSTAQATGDAMLNGTSVRLTGGSAVLAANAILAASGSLALGDSTKVTTGGNAKLTAGGILSLGNAAAIDATAGNITLTAGTDLAIGGGSRVRVVNAGTTTLTATGGNLSVADGASVVAPGDISLAAGTGIAVGNGVGVQSAAGNVTVVAVGGAITIGAPATLEATAGAVALTAATDLTIGSGTTVRAGGTTLALSAGNNLALGIGAKTVSQGGTTLSGRGVDVGAGAAVQSLAGPIAVTAPIAFAVEGAGSVTAGGNLTVNAGTITVADSGLVQSLAGSVALGSNTGISLAAGAKAIAFGGGIALTAATTVGLANTATVQAVGGGIAIAAGDDLRASGAVLKASGQIDIAIDAGNTDPGVGATADLGGATIEATNTTIRGGPDSDSFLVSGYTTPVMIDGKAPTGGSVGDSLQFDAENQPVFSTGTSFNSKGGEVSYTDIEVISVVRAAGAFTIRGTGADDRLTVTRAGSVPLRYQFEGQVPVTVAGIQSFEFDGLAGRDTLVADFSQGSPIPAGGLTFDGGDGDDIGIAILDQGGQTATVTSGPNRTGTVTFPGQSGTTETIAYRNLEASSQVDITGLATVNVNLAVPDAAVDINTGAEQTSRGTPSAALVVSGNSIPRIGLFNDTNVNLTTSGSGGGGAVGITRGDNANGVTNLAITAATDVVTANGPLTVAGTLRIAARGTVVQGGGNLTAGASLELNNANTLSLGSATLTAPTVAQTGGAAVTLTGDARIDAKGTAGDTVTFSGTVDGPGSLTTFNGGTTVFNKAVGSTTPVANLLTDAGGRTRINGGSVKTSALQSYGDAVSFSADATLAGTGGTIIFFDAVDPDGDGFNLTIGGPNVDVTTAKGIGTNRKLATLTIADANNATFYGTLDTTAKIVQTNGTGTTAFNGVVNTPAVLIANAKDVTFNGPLTTASLVQTTGTGTTTFAGGAFIQPAGGGVGTFNVNTQSLAFNGPVAVPGGRVILGLRNGGSATQSAAGTLTAAMLDLNGAGVFTLDNAGNQLTSDATDVVANVTAGSVNVFDSTNLVIGFETAGTTAITVGNGDVTLSTGADFTANDPAITSTVVEASVAKLLNVGTGNIQVNPGVGRPKDAATKVRFVAEALATTVTIGQPGTGGDLANASKDTFVVRPMTGAKLVVNGNSPVTADGNRFAPFDTLKPDFDGVDSVSLAIDGPATSNNGTYSFQGSNGFKDLVYTSIESLGGFSLEAFVVQTGPRVGSETTTSYAVRLKLSQVSGSNAIPIPGNISGSGIVTNPFVVTPTIGSQGGAFAAPTITAAFIDDDAFPDLIIANGPGDAPIVTIIRGSSIVGRTIDLSNLQPSDLIAQFFAFEETFRGGLNVATGDFDGDGTPEVAVGAGVGGAPRITVFKIDTHKVDPATGAPAVFNNVSVFTNASGTPYNFFPYESSFRGGVNVAVGDVNNDGVADLIAGAGQGGGPRVRVYSGKDTTTTLRDFFAYDSSFRGGVLVSAGRFDSDGAADLVTAPGSGGGPHIKVWLGSTDSASIFTQNPISFFAFNETNTVASVISSQNTLVSGVSSVTFGASADGNGGSRSILVSRPKGDSFEVIKFEFKRNADGTYAMTTTPDYQLQLNSGSNTIDTGNGTSLGFDTLRQGGSVGAGTADPDDQ